MQPIDAQPGARKTADAFTMAETMFAIVIMGICMAMAAGLFPAAVQMNEDSFETTIGNMIVDNGLAIAKLRLAHPLSVSTTELDDVSDRIDPDDRSYPIAEGERRGFKVFARRMRADANDYLLVVVTYSKDDEGNEINAHSYSENVPRGAVTFSLGNARYCQPNGVIISHDGAWATVGSIEGNEVTLRAPLKEHENTGGFIAMYEQRDGGAVAEVMSPGMQVLAVRTSLKTGGN